MDKATLRAEIDQLLDACYLEELYVIKRLLQKSSRNDDSCTHEIIHLEKYIVQVLKDETDLLKRLKV